MKLRRYDSLHVIAAGVALRECVRTDPEYATNPEYAAAADRLAAFADRLVESAIARTATESQLAPKH